MKAKAPILFVSLTTIGAFLYYLLFLQQARGAASIAITTAGRSPAVQTALGTSVKAGTLITGWIVGFGPDSGNADLDVPVQGTLSHGTLHVWAQNGFGGWHLCSLSLTRESKGAEIAILRDADAVCERE